MASGLANFIQGALTGGAQAGTAALRRSAENKRVKSANAEKDRKEQELHAFKNRQLAAKLKADMLMQRRKMEADQQAAEARAQNDRFNTLFRGLPLDKLTPESLNRAFEFARSGASGEAPAFEFQTPQAKPLSQEDQALKKAQLETEQARRKEIAGRSTNQTGAVGNLVKELNALTTSDGDPIPGAESRVAQILDALSVLGGRQAEQSGITSEVAAAGDQRTTDQAIERLNDSSLLEDIGRFFGVVDPVPQINTIDDLDKLAASGEISLEEYVAIAKSKGFKAD